MFNVLVLDRIFYILTDNDLCTLSTSIVIFKYADDTNILEPENSDVPLVGEFANFLDWACINKMMIDLSKTKEIVFHIGRRQVSLP